MDFIPKLRRTPSSCDTIWVNVDRLTKSAHFLAIKEMNKREKLACIYLEETISQHGGAYIYYLWSWFPFHLLLMADITEIIRYPIGYE